MFFLPLAAFLFQDVKPVHPAPDAVVATIDGAPITAAEIDPYLWDRYSRAVIDEMVGHRLIAAEAKRKGVSASDAEVKALVDQQIASIKANIPPGQTLETFLQSPEVGGLGRLNLVARSSILVDKLAGLEFKPDGYVKVATMVFRTTGDTTDALSKAIKSADAAYASLQAGKAWETVLRQYEKDPRIVANGGLVGWKAEGAFPASVQTSFASLKPLGYTKPTQTPNGIQIFRILARGAASSPTDLAELKAQYVASARASVMARLRSAAKVEVKK